MDGLGYGPYITRTMTMANNKLPEDVAVEPIGYMTPDDLAELCERRIAGYIFPKGTLRPENETPVYAAPPSSEAAELKQKLKEMERERDVFRKSYSSRCDDVYNLQIKLDEVKKERDDALARAEQNAKASVEAVRLAAGASRGHQLAAAQRPHSGRARRDSGPLRQHWRLHAVFAGFRRH